ncbi:cytochrome c [Paracoccus sp. IB05]|uniref:c-type cytochrome n=1 Tax=Paracoccus sp. IB05 TaxID=2779367 RepID=UPI0018E8C91D|nr:cytochrome c [Paracoccus sp. IB05]MBJ2153692.1 cytochrome c [Paracoccus sp. IB05]
MRPVTAALLTSLLFATAAFAADPTQPEAIERAKLMKEIGLTSKILGEMASGKAPYEAAAAEAAKTVLIAAAGQIDTVFATAGADDPVSEALPAIWTSWEDFTTKSAGFGQAAAALDTSSAETIKAGMGTIGASCKACHSVYRE